MDDLIDQIARARSAFYSSTGTRPRSVRLGRLQVDALLGLFDLTSDALPIHTALGLRVVTDAGEDVLAVEG